MTNKQALIAVLMVSVPDDAAEKALIDGGVTSSATYNAADAKAIDLAAIGVLRGLLSTPDISEGGYSVKYDREAVEAMLKMLNEKYFPESVVKPTIRAAKVW